MSVIVASCTLAQLFSKESIVSANETEIHGELAIPEYQRPYRWGEVQITKLLSDYQLFLNDLTQSDAAYGYYLGSVILHQSADNGQLNIIDGQQRLTTLALIAYVQSLGNQPSEQDVFELNLSYDSPESQQQIIKNLTWLQEWLQSNASQIVTFDANKINLTLVVTRSEDDAYRFFETQNTGGVRLSGPDIIKAHHLRAIARQNQNEFAAKWEALGDLNPVVGSLVKGRYWQKLYNRNVPSHRQPHLVRSAVVNELGESTGKGDDIAFGRFERAYLPDGGQIDKQAQQGYELRQPLNSGINTIHYLSYFEQLRSKYLIDPFKNNKVKNNKVKNKNVIAKTSVQGGNQGENTLARFSHFYQNLICELDGCSYVKGLYDTALLIYISQFGEQQLDIAAKKLFRVIYSPRVSNQKAVRENSISAFVRDNPVLDWIAASYTPNMCFDYLDRFSFKTDPANLAVDKNSVKKRFIFNVLKHFGIEVIETESAQTLANTYTVQLDAYILSLGTETVPVNQLSMRKNNGEQHG
ncbi:MULTISPECIES: DUF262 domain-containing protein [unclassified Pseudoalteromonas]|uniref:DUF262 domain-containing protein n=1 Tax=unclassified Pseudoalteromonas TaxID=194690 RepID=UPI001602D1DB|nr:MULTISPECIES: DUF262 domain-containing protein [unclassified Pseudoalteromonas]MBB1335235.1 DUF262 domain-containing protein [Pseudoalteromonas sp. SR41-6]MBB1343551.1 DUF262 domain-containing protein [Pseudoalteromonas sp. SR45-6]MBB1460695.1 DUF262 domain-containing protein [Pseudoalteromonas sp. SG41-8]